MRKWFKSSWGISICTAIFSFLLTVGYDLFRDKPIFSTILSMFKTIWDYLLFVLEFELKVWWVLVSLAGLSVILYILAKTSDAKSDDRNKAPFLLYTSDVINGWHWAWIWERGYDRKWAVEGLHPICPVCDTPLVYINDYVGHIECIRCHRKYSNEISRLEHVKMLIYDNVKKKSVNLKMPDGHA